MKKLFRLTWTDPCDHNARLCGEWVASATEAKKQIKTNRLNKYDCVVERMQIDDSAYGLANLINENIFFVGVSAENKATFSTKWCFADGRSY